ncbi:hypothetical protein [Demequina sp.]|uniref:hypothetical protein n=1 Tax=Demequina sp. TaxID=2050685 RepID=UPI0025DFB6ED|nr:hypothetical protein [Demequina sp.]
MTVLRIVLLILHFIGLAAILGPFLEQWWGNARRITMAMVWGARAQVVTGLGLVAVAYASDHEPDHAKVAVKLVIALAIAGLAEANRKKDSAPRAWLLVGVLTAVNIAVAVAWR